MATTIYMKVTGKNQGEIQGDCTQQGRENLILCYQMDHAVEIPKDTHTGLPTGQRVNDRHNGATDFRRNGASEKG